MRYHKKDVKTPAKKESYIINDEGENGENSDNENCEHSEKGNKCEVVDIKDYFQIEFVDGEPVFACNICNEGLDTEEEISNHIRDEHESIMNDDLNISDTDLYEGFDEDGNRIVQDDHM